MRLLYFLSVLLVFTLGCSNEPSGDHTVLNQENVLDKEALKKQKENPPPIPGNAYAISIEQDPALNEHLTQYFTSGLWSIEGGYFSDKKREENFTVGDEYQFYPDHSFDFNLGKENARSGKWAIEEENKVLKLDFETGKDAEFSFKSVSEFMVWVATKTFEEENIQIKLRRKRLSPS